jgi:hypothetical protein
MAAAAAPAEPGQAMARNQLQGWLQERALQHSCWLLGLAALLPRAAVLLPREACSAGHACAACCSAPCMLQACTRTITGTTAGGVLAIGAEWRWVLVGA